MSAHTVKWLARAGLILLVALCLYGMLGPERDMERAYIPWDKATHFIAFYLLTVLSFLSFPKSRRTDLLQILLLLAVSSELAQHFAGRDAEVSDGVADVLGVLTCFVTSYSEQLRRRYRDSPHGGAFSRGRRKSSSPRRPAVGVRAAGAAPTRPAEPPRAQQVQA